MLAGDGYRGKTSPHTPNERFEGATVLKALKVELPPSQIHALLRGQHGADPLAPCPCPVRLRGPRPAEERPALLRHQREGPQDRRVLLHAELHALLLLHAPGVPHRSLR